MADATWLPYVVVAIGLACAGLSLYLSTRATRRAEDARRRYEQNLKDARREAVTKQRADWMAHNSKDKK